MLGLHHVMSFRTLFAHSCRCEVGLLRLLQMTTWDYRSVCKLTLQMKYCHVLNPMQACHWTFYSSQISFQLNLMKTVTSMKYNQIRLRLLFVNAYLYAVLRSLSLHLSLPLCFIVSFSHSWTCYVHLTLRFSGQVISVRTSHHRGPLTIRYVTLWHRSTPISRQPFLKVNRFWQDLLTVIISTTLSMIRFNVEDNAWSVMHSLTCSCLMCKLINWHQSRTWLVSNPLHIVTAAKVPRVQQQITKITT